MADIVLAGQWGAIMSMYSERSEIRREIKLDQAQQNDFIAAAGKAYFERPDDFAQLDAYADGVSRKIFVLTGEAGVGKSSLLANWVRRRRAMRNQVGTVCAWFLGVSDRANNVDNLEPYRQF